MDDALLKVAYSLAPTLLGALGTGVMWLSKVVYKAKTDLDIAHNKIRELESRMTDLEDDIGNLNS